MDAAKTPQDQVYCQFRIQAANLTDALDVAPDVSECIEMCREVAFRAGWAAALEWRDRELADEPTVRLPRTARVLTTVGDRGWVEPFAIVEHTETGHCFVDPLFGIRPTSTPQHSIELVVAADGLVAIGPSDCHRLCPTIDEERLLPLVAFEP
ncbi:MAG: hypothetical protein K0V04_20850, partial [Deltaproteobacteria bacterium]|nr:hypothetical protein [Deltaproteobacteria bacterium]